MKLNNYERLLCAFVLAQSALIVCMIDKIRQQENKIIVLKVLTESQKLAIELYREGESDEKTE